MPLLARAGARTVWLLGAATVLSVYADGNDARPGGRFQVPTPAMPDPTVRFVPTVGPSDSVSLGQDFRIVVTVPVKQAAASTLDVVLTSRSGDEASVTVTRGESAYGQTTYTSGPLSLGGERGAMNVPLAPVGLVPILIGSVDVGGFTTRGSIGDLDLSNGDAVTATVTTPTWSAGSSMLVFDSELDQALHRGYTGLYAWHTRLLNEQRINLALQASGQVTDPDMLAAINQSIATNGMLLQWIRRANEWLAVEDRPYAQFAIMNSFLSNIASVYAGGPSQDGQLDTIDQAIRKNIETWRGTVPIELMRGYALAFYNGTTAIPLVSSTYTLLSSGYTSATTGEFNTGQTVWGTEATTGQWVWAVVDTGLTGMSLVRMATGPSATGGALDPFRDPTRTALGGAVRSGASSMVPVSQALTPYEVGVWSLAARYTQFMAKPGMTAAEINAIQEANLRLVSSVAESVGLPNAARVIDGMNAAVKAGHAIDDYRVFLKTPARNPFPPIPPPGPSVSLGGAATTPAAAPGSPIFLPPSVASQLGQLRQGLDPTLVRALQQNGPLIQNAARNPGLVQVTVNGATRPLTQQEQAYLCWAADAIRTGGRGTTQSLAAMPLLGAMQQCFSGRMESGEQSLKTGDASSPAPRVSEAIEHLEPWTAPYHLDGRGNSWYSVDPDDQPRAAFGELDDTYYLGDDPWEGYTYDDAVDDFIDGDLDAIDRWFEAIQPEYADEGTDDKGQNVAALLRSIAGRPAVLIVPPYVARQEGDDRAQARALFARPVYAAVSPQEWRRVSHGSPVDSRQNARRSGPAIKVFFTSTGRMGPGAFTMTVVNTAPAAAYVNGEALTLRPVRVTPQQAAREIKSLARYPQASIAVDAYCEDFTKRPPAAGTVYALAPAKQQSRLLATRRIARAVGKLRPTFKPDMDPEQYSHAMAQWALWSLRERWDERGFTRAFLQHSRQNVVAAGQRWTSALEQQITGLAPARWQAIRAILQQAGLSTVR